MNILNAKMFIVFFVIQSRLRRNTTTVKQSSEKAYITEMDLNNLYVPFLTVSLFWRDNGNMVGIKREIFSNHIWEIENFIRKDEDKL